MFKSITNFFKTKTAVAVAKSLSPEDQYTRAASEIIDKITELRTRHLTATQEAKDFRLKAQEKRNQKVQKDNLIKSMQAQSLPVETHVRLAILFQRTADAFDKRALELDTLVGSIETAVVELDNRRQDLSARLELLRESRAAQAMGINTEDDLIQEVGITNINVDDMLMRITTFTSEPEMQTTTSVEIQEYLDSLK